MQERNGIMGILVIGTLCACADGAVIDTTATSLDEGTVVPGDDPSPDVVTLSWAFAPDGTARRGLPMTVTSRWDVPVDVTISAVAMEGNEAPISRDVVAERLLAGTKRAITIDVRDLPLQLIERSVNVLLVATHVGPDGQRRHSFSTPVWVAHQRDFRQAVVRTASQEAVANASLGTEEVAALLAEPEGRLIRDTETGPQVFSLDAVSSKHSNGRSTVVAVAPPRGTSERANVSDAGDSPSIEKGFVTQVCVRVFYAYNDAKLGEDFLLGDHPLVPWGFVPARFMTLWILKSDSSWGSSFVTLNSNGCTPIWDMPSGSYNAYLYPLLSHSSGANVSVWRTNAHAYEPTTTTFSLTSAGVVNLDMGNFSTLNNVAVLVSTAMQNQGSAFVASNTHVHVEQNCNNDGSGSGCYTELTGTVWLGNDTDGNSKAFKKFNVLHEFGHMIQHRRNGIWTTDYNDLGPNAACTCAHVPVLPGDMQQLPRKHCLQSREHISDVQMEGFGHFFAADVLNVGSQSDCAFNYYKRFRADNGVFEEPPVSKSCVTPITWLERAQPGFPQTCLENQNHRGVEWDWMNFYWSLRNKTSNAYSYAQMGSVYTQACSGGGCAGTPAPQSAVRWNNLQAAANAVFGVNTARALHWQTTGDTFGVNH